MPRNCHAVDKETVLAFFTEEIDGMGQHDGHPRNQGTPTDLALCNNWKLCELTHEEFFNMLIPDGTNTLIENKELLSTEGESKDTILKWLDLIQKGVNIPPIIVRTRLETETIDFSFYIEDGAHRAIAYKVYFEEYEYLPVIAYIGVRNN